MGYAQVGGNRAVKATRAQLEHLHRRGWQWNKFGQWWTRKASAYDLAGTKRRLSPIQVSSAAQALIVDDACKRRWDAARVHAYPPELFGYADAL